MKYSMEDLTQEQREIAQKNGIKYNTLVKRLVNGWDIERAIGEESNEVGKTRNKKTEEGYISNSYFSLPNTLLKCSVEGCNHVGEVITKVHCRIAHNMDRKDVAKVYGMPIIIEKKNLHKIENPDKIFNSTSLGLGVL